MDEGIFWYDMSMGFFLWKPLNFFTRVLLKFFLKKNLVGYFSYRASGRDISSRVINRIGVE